MDTPLRQPLLDKLQSASLLLIAGFAALGACAIAWRLIAH